MKFDQMEKKFNENEDEQGNSASRFISYESVSVNLTTLSKRDHKVDDKIVTDLGFPPADELLAA